MTLCKLTRLILLWCCAHQPLSSPPLLPLCCFHEVSRPEQETGCLSLGHPLGSLTSQSRSVSSTLPTLTSPSPHHHCLLAPGAREPSLCTQKMVNKMVWIYFSVTASRHCQPPPLSAPVKPSSKPETQHLGGLRDLVRGENGRKSLDCFK